MKKILVFIAFASFFVLAGNAGAATQDIIINEIGAYETTDYEWLEIYNRGQQSVDLMGWKFVEDFSDSKPNGTNHGLNFIQGGSILAAGQYAIIAQNDVKFKEKYLNFTGLLIDSSWSTLNKSGEKVGLKDSGENFSELFTYIEAKNYSLERKESNLNDYTTSNWQEHPSGNTAGTQNTNTSSNQSDNAPTDQSINTTNQQSNIATNEQNGNAPIGQSTNTSSNQNNTESIISNSQNSNYYILNSIRANAGENIIALAGQEIYFDASKSQGALSYEWNFGDGATSKEKIAKHKYNFPGKHIVVLTISDGQTNAQTQITASVYPPGVYINEFLPSPEGSDDNEWIEIHNSNNFSVNLSGWRLDDEDGGSKIFTIPQNTFVAPQSYLALSRSVTGIALNNDKDSVRFFYPENVLIEEIKYEKSKENFSASRKSDGNFVWSQNISPGSPNIFSSDEIKSTSRQNNQPGQKVSASAQSPKSTINNKFYIVSQNNSSTRNFILTANAQTVSDESASPDNNTQEQSPSELKNTKKSAKLSANIGDAISGSAGNAIVILFVIIVAFGIFVLLRRFYEKTK